MTYEGFAAIGLLLGLAEHWCHEPRDYHEVLGALDDFSFWLQGVIMSLDAKVPPSVDAELLQRGLGPPFDITPYQE